MCHLLDAVTEVGLKTVSPDADKGVAQALSRYRQGSGSARKSTITLRRDKDETEYER
jgi:hypothetical protein